jgi:hypothetical protein
MGDVHAVEGDPAAGAYVVVNRYTGERTPVVVDPDKAGLLALPPIPGACPLFRRDAAGAAVCPVHDTWPAICAEYACWRLLVVDGDGRRAGRVMGSRHIDIDDPALDAMLASWRAALAGAGDDAAWDALLAGALAGTSYRVVR